MIVVVVENAVLREDIVLDKEAARQRYAALASDGWRRVPVEEVVECNMSARRMRVAGRR